MNNRYSTPRLTRNIGGAMIEFALVLPLLLLVTFGIIEFSIALYDKAVITNASREGARAGVIFRTPALTDEQISTIVIDASEAHLITFGAATTPQVSVTRPNGGTAGNPLTVTVTYDFTGLMLGDLLSVMTGTHTLVSATTMVIE